MSNEYSLYPTLNNRLIKEIGYSRLSYDFSFTEGKHEREIKVDKSIDSTEIVINDLDGSWSSDRHNLFINFDIMITDGSKLFLENGLVAKGSTIGIAVQWYSKDSRQRKTEVLGQMKHGNSDHFFLEKKIEILKGQVRKSVSFSLFLFIMESDHLISENESYKANTVGQLLGELDRFDIIIDGEGSDFPLTTYKHIGGPLWKIVCNWEDPTEDSFNDTVTIQLNRGHKDYMYIDNDRKIDFNSFLLDEIILNSYEIIINKLRNSVYSQEIEEGRYSPGSVAAAIDYLLKTFEIDNANEETLAESLRTKVIFGK